MKTIMRYRIWILIALCLPVPLASGAIRYVKHDAAGGDDGSSWADAHTSLSAAIEAAAPYDEIWIAAGTYLPEQAVGGGEAGDERRRSFLFYADPLSVYGGFDGTETNRSQRDWNANPTVLSGDLGVEGNRSDNAYS